MIGLQNIRDGERFAYRWWTGHLRDKNGHSCTFLRAYGSTCDRDMPIAQPNDAASANLSLMMSVQVEYHRAQLAKSNDEGARLGGELKRTQESLLFLSAWDEEKIELESEVGGGAAENDARPAVDFRPYKPVAL